MGTLYIDWADDLYRAAGLDVVVVSGAERRARGSGGFNGKVEAVFNHHTAGGYDPNHDWASADYGTFRHPDKPCANEYIARSGRIWLTACGAANTQGAGGPLGTLPKDGANARAWAKEICNRGTGETYPQIQQDVILESNAVLIADFIRRGYFTLDEVGAWRSSTHYIWAPTRKIDLSGPCQWNDYENRKWDMGRFNHSLFVRLQEILGITVQPPAPVPAPPGPPDPNGNPPEEWHEFGLGAEGDHVVRWQYALTVNQAPIPGGCDGKFGVNTRDHTQWWQGTHALPQTQLADITTARSLGFNAVAPTPPPPPVVEPPPVAPPAPQDPRQARISDIGLYRVRADARWGVELPYTVAQRVYGNGAMSTLLTQANPAWPKKVGERVWVPQTAGVLLVAQAGDSPWSLVDSVWDDNINARMGKFIEWNGQGVTTGETYFLPA